jgi:hypothetical protein
MRHQRPNRSTGSRSGPARRSVQAAVVVVALVIVLIIVFLLLNQHPAVRVPIAPTKDNNSLNNSVKESTPYNPLQEDASNNTLTVSDVRVFRRGVERIVTTLLDNNRSMPADCNLSITVGSERFHRIVGIVEPLSVKNYSTLIATQSNETLLVKAACAWREIDTNGCENTTFELCELSRAVPGVAECLPYAQSYQYFCAARIINNSQLCDRITLIRMHTLCRAYLDDQPDRCEGLGDWSDWCFNDLGTNLRRTDLCARITNSTLRSRCTAFVARDPAVCAAAKDPTECYRQFAELQH